METRPTPIRQTPYRGRNTLLAALGALVSAGFSKGSKEYDATAKAGYRRYGKHNGRQAGAFGGRHAAKAHRRLYVAA